jgi:hypothetical protein
MRKSCDERDNDGPGQQATPHEQAERNHQNNHYSADDPRVPSPKQGVSDMPSIELPAAADSTP